uniref:Uncharacterized protein n=1 Tax=Rhizophora mucronata TaxID=61149 RepID=A0A2P2QJQ0_RHIMU
MIIVLAKFRLWVFLVCLDAHLFHQKVSTFLITVESSV